MTMETLKGRTIINDSIWGPIELHRLCVKIIDTPQFQRLRFIKQLGGCSYVYPGERENHEDTSLKMIDEIFKTIEYKDDIGEDDIEFVKELIQKPSEGEYKTKPKEKHYLFEIVANKLNGIDVDKWDYFSRDCHMLGLHHNFQSKRTIKLAKVVEHEGQWHISYPKTEWFNLFDMFYTRFTLHRRAYQHPVCKAVEMMITDALLKADRWLTFPPDKEDGVCLSESVGDMNAYLWVTDDVFHRIRALKTNDEQDTEDEQDIKEAKKILDRIESRDLYKLVREKKVTFLDMENLDSEKKKAVLESLKNWSTQTNLQQDRLSLFKTLTMEYNYGNGDKSPLENVKFYENDKPASLSNDELSAMLPSTFEQVYLQLYWKGSKNDAPYEEVMKTFNDMENHACDEGAVKLVTTR